MHTPTKSSYPRDLASGITTATKAIVSSLIPNTAPKRPNRSITRVITMFPTPSLRTSPNRSRLWTLEMNFMIPSSTALVLLTTQNAPPMISTKAMMPACWLNPSYNAENTCQVCGSPPGTSQVATAHTSRTANMITYVFGTLILPIMSRTLKHFRQCRMRVNNIFELFYSCFA